VATAAIPIVFGVGDDPVKLGLVASLARPGGNLTGFNSFSNEALSKRLALLHELVPNARRIALLVNPNLASTEATVREAQDAAHTGGLSIDILKASASREIEEAFAFMARERITAVLIVGDPYFFTRRFQLITLATRHGITSCYPTREFTEAGGLMSYGTDFADMWHQAGIYAGRILQGAKPAELPVQQAVRFEFAINMQTASALGIEVPPRLLVQADVVIE
jgi:putative tryptophan/tyrosine transport system substrate-binding protein